jgi:butyryl-CoA dehydrogenase
VARRANGDDASDWIITGAKKWASSATGWDGRGADLMTVVCRTDPNAPPERAISVIAVTGPAPGVMLERAIDSIGHRAHLLPEFRLDRVRTSADNVIGSVGGGKGLVEACFSGTAPIVGMFAVGLMRAAFDAALTFARTERRGGAVPIIEYQAVGYALADAKTAIEAVRTLSWRAAHAVKGNRRLAITSCLCHRHVHRLVETPPTVRQTSQTNKELHAVKREIQEKAE